MKTYVKNIPALAAALLTGAFLVSTPWQGVAAAQVQSWLFDVWLDDKPIGSHEFVVQGTKTGSTVEIDASFDVRFLRIPLYSYRHRNTEQWSDGCLTTLDSRTDDNGEHITVTARHTGAELMVQTNGDSSGRFTGCTRSFAYWDPSFLGSDALLNAQTGELVTVSIEAIEPHPDMLRASDGELDAYRITATEPAIDIEVAYTRQQGRWVYLQSNLDNGRTLRYLPREPSVVDENRSDVRGQRS
jgi:hypothetical protein